MQPEALPRSLSPQANNLNSTQEATFLQTNSLVESVDNHLLVKYSPELVIFSIDDSSIISVLYPVSESVPRLYILTVRGLNVFNESVAMDVPEPDQTPFNAVQAQTSKLARVSSICFKAMPRS